MKKNKRVSLQYMGSKDKIMPEIYAAMKRIGILKDKNDLIVDPFFGGGAATVFFRSKGHETFSGEYDKDIVDIFHMMWRRERERVKGYCQREEEVVL